MARLGYAATLAPMQTTATISPLPTPEQEQRAKWDLLLLDIEHRTEQVRQMKAFEGRRLAIQAITAAAAVFAAGGVVGGVLVHLLHG